MPIITLCGVVGAAMPTVQLYSSETAVLESGKVILSLLRDVFKELFEGMN